MSGTSDPFSRFEQAVRSVSTPVARVGEVRALRGPMIRASLPEAVLGEICRVDHDGGPLPCEVVGFDGVDVLLVPLAHPNGLRVRARVEPLAGPLMIPSDASTRGRVIDALGRPVDGRPGILGPPDAAVVADPPPAMQRDVIREPMPTGVSSLDALLTLGRGQRMGIFAGPGVGKSTLMGMIAAFLDQESVDSIVIALIGERGREVREFHDEILSEDARRRATLVVSTSDEPAMRRVKAAHAATAIAEARRARGEHVLLMMDSLTRFARAIREIGVASNEPVGRQGYPGSLYAELPRLVERAGSDGRGAITAIYTVLVQGEVRDDVVAEEVKSLLDGHVELRDHVRSRPRIDQVSSVSRVFEQLQLTAEHRAAAAWARERLQLWSRNEREYRLGLLDPGRTDIVAAIRTCEGPLTELFSQDRGERRPWTETVERLVGLHAAAT